MSSLLSALILLATEWPRLFQPGANTLSQTGGSGRLRVVSWKVAGGMPLDDLAADAPDIATLQEIGSVPEPSIRPPASAEFTRLADLDPGILSRRSEATSPSPNARADSTQRSDGPSPRPSPELWAPPRTSQRNRLDAERSDAPKPRPSPELWLIGSYRPLHRICVQGLESERSDLPSPWPSPELWAPPKAWRRAGDSNPEGP